MSRNNLADAYQDAGRTAEAIALHEATLKLWKPSWAPTTPTRSAAATTWPPPTSRPAGLGGDRAARGDAQADGGQAGPRPPRHAHQPHNLATAYQDAGRLSEAIALYRGDAQAPRVEAGPRPSRHARDPQATWPPPTSRSAAGPRPRACMRDGWPAAARPTKPDSPLLAGDLAALGQNLLEQCAVVGGRAAAARVPGDPREGDARRLAAVRHDEPAGRVTPGPGPVRRGRAVVVAGYEGMKAREARIAVPERSASARPPSGSSASTRLGQARPGRGVEGQAGHARPARRRLRPAVSTPPPLMSHGRGARSPIAPGRDASGETSGIGRRLAADRSAWRLRVSTRTRRSRGSGCRTTNWRCPAHSRHT